jgi:hypothetical protein
MEVLIGFAVGYWVGTRQGREGLERTMDSVRAIAARPETRRLLGVGRSAGGRGTGLAVTREHEAHAA